MSKKQIEKIITKSNKCKRAIEKIALETFRKETDKKENIIPKVTSSRYQIIVPPERLNINRVIVEAERDGIDAFIITGDKSGLIAVRGNLPKEKNKAISQMKLDNTCAIGHIIAENYDLFFIDKLDAKTCTPEWHFGTFDPLDIERIKNEIEEILSKMKPNKRFPKPLPRQRFVVRGWRINY